MLDRFWLTMQTKDKLILMANALRERILDFKIIFDESLDLTNKESNKG